MMKRLGSIFLLAILMILGFNQYIPRPETILAQTPQRVELSCHAEVRWNYLTNLRRGPSTNFGIQRQLDWRTPDLWVFGQDTEGEWFHAYLSEPEMTGWVWRENINLYGKCDDLPDTSANPEIETTPNRPPQMDLPDFAADLKFTENDTVYWLNSGMLYVRHEIEDPALQIHMVVIDLTAEALHIEPYIGAVPHTSATLVSEMVAETGAYIAINGDFYAGNYMPQGLTVIDGEVITSPKFRASFALTEDNEPFIGHFTTEWSWQASVQTTDEESWIPLQLMNVPCDPGWLCLYSDAVGFLPNRFGFEGIHVLINEDLEVVSVQSGYVDIPEGHYVLQGGYNTATGQWLLENLEVGDSIILNLTTDPAWQDYQNAISGGPLILEESEFRQDCDPEVDEEERICEEFADNFRVSHYGENHIPRTGIGYSEDKNLLFLTVVEGYEIDHSGGLTQREFADFFLGFGADYAMEFDGGGSSSMWIENGFVNDFGSRGERKLSNALMIYWDE